MSYLSNLADLDTHPRAFAHFMRQRMKERRMSQRALAVFAGIDHSTISRLLREGRQPTLDTAIRIAKALEKERHGR